MLKKLMMTVVSLFFLGFSSNSSMAIPVDVELQLLIDVSGSIDATEYQIQMNGYRDAFQNAAVQNAVASGALGTIAVQLIQWSGAGQQSISIDWTQLTTAAEMNAFGDAIAALPQLFFGQTAPGSAIAFGAPLFDNNGFEGLVNVMDVSGDGIENDGVDTSDARDAALAGSVDRINGLTIGGGAALVNWYTDNVAGGSGSFVTVALDFDDFAPAILEKIGREVGVPEPGALGLLGLGIVFVGLRLGRRQRSYSC